jgi:hypothetical protein
MITRKDYIEHRATFEEYYSDVCEAAGIKVTSISLIKRVQEALGAGDEHLNTIPLPDWDMMAMNARRVLENPLKERGDFFSLGSGVCAMKQAARNAAKL